MPRFVVLSHDWPSQHWDLMLEKEAALRTWRLSSEPGPSTPTAALQLPDHRLTYLTYEGPLSGNRGAVGRWDYGTLEWLQESNEHIRVRLGGRRLRGLAALDVADSASAWTFHFTPDSAASSA
jgi:hypothetical protein